MGKKNLTVKKKLTGKPLSNHLKRKLEKILIADHKEALNLIKNNNQNYQVDITNSVSEIRKLIVDRVGRILFSKMGNPLLVLFYITNRRSTNRTLLWNTPGWLSTKRVVY